jgi:hypothetical protein
MAPQYVYLGGNLSFRFGSRPAFILRRNGPTVPSPNWPVFIVLRGSRHSPLGTAPPAVCFRYRRSPVIITGAFHLRWTDLLALHSPARRVTLEPVPAMLLTASRGFPLRRHNLTTAFRMGYELARSPGRNNRTTSSPSVGKSHHKSTEAMCRCKTYRPRMNSSAILATNKQIVSRRGPRISVNKASFKTGRCPSDAISRTYGQSWIDAWSGSATVSTATRRHDFFPICPYEFRLSSLCFADTRVCNYKALRVLRVLCSFLMSRLISSQEVHPGISLSAISSKTDDVPKLLTH